MAMSVAVISGKKVQEDDITRWFIYCYECGKAVSESVLDSSVLDDELKDHIASHESH
jgi:hypothetical protein